MDGRIRGGFPGGPSKSLPAEERTRDPRLTTVEAIEARTAHRQVRRRRRAREWRMAVSVLLSMLLSGAAGLYLGRRSHTTIEEVRAQAQQDAREASDVASLSTEVNRALLELWKMEDVEYQRNSR